MPKYTPPSKNNVDFQLESYTPLLRTEVDFELAGTNIRKDLKYSVLTSSKISKSLKYSVVDKQSINKSLQYRVISSKNITKSLKYRVETTPSALTKSLKYSVLTQNSITKQLKYSVIYSDSITKSLKYSVLTNTSLTKQLKYSVESPKSITKSLKYRVIGTHQKTKQLRYAVETTPAAITKSLQYKVRSISIKVNGTEIREQVSYPSLEVQNNLYSNPDFASFEYINKSGIAYTPSAGDEIAIYDSEEKIFAGILINITKRLDGIAEIYNLEFKDWTEELGNIIVDEVYTNQTVNQIISDINTNYLSGYDITNVDDSTNIDRVVFDNISVTKCLDKLVEISNHNWYVDPDKNIYVFADGDLNAPYDLTDTNGYYDWKTLKVDEDYSQIRNKVSIQGKNIALVTVQDATSQSTYGVREYVERDDDITSQSEATQKANAILTAYKDPIKKATFKTRNPGLYSGQEINISSTKRSLTSQNYVINKVIFRADHYNQFIYQATVKTQKEKDLTDLIEAEVKKPLTTTPLSDQGFLSEIKFTATNYNTISWNSGDIRLAGGTTYSITGDTETLTSDHIIYLDPETSETALQISTNFADGIGAGKIPLAYASKQSVTTKNADIIPVAFGRKIQLDGSVHITDRSVIADQLAANTITANEIAANTITASEISANTITANEMNVSQLSAISADIGSITAGSLDAITITGSTITGTLIRTSTSGDRVEIDDTNDELNIYDSSGDVGVKLTNGSLQFFDSSTAQVVLSASGTDTLSIDLQNLGSGYTINSTAILPGTSSQNLGNSTLRWAKLYTSNIDMTGVLDVASATIQGDLEPDSDDTYNIGTTSSIWHYLFIDSIYYYNQQKLDLSPSSGPQWKNTPMGFYVRSGTPGSASSYQGYMYYDTSKQNLVYSDGTGWFEVNASSY